MKELIQTQNDNSGEIIVSGRELHEFLGVKTKYNDWFNRMKAYGFVENSDFVLVTQKRETNNPRNPYTEIQDHHIKLDMAKEISMLQRTERGKQARQYFIQLEKQWNSPEMIMKRALEIANDRVEKLRTSNLMLEQRVSEYEPKATYYDTVLQNKSLLSISKIAKDYGFSGTKLNKLLHELGVQYKQGNMWLLYQKYADRGYTQSKTHVIDAETSKLHTQWTQKGRLFIYDLLKNELGILPIIEREEEKQGDRS
ncbi:phage antirepressor KilAC domain-containing protein [Virgibacillus salexigens]|uniref:phage antirepressor KilAC domain-containing protein n=1 Tax=Virgibacillus salexigens TaxID=61016 RepID=UPI003081EDAA